MIYTCGHTESYERYFREQGTPSKLGRGMHEGRYYQGGSVWKTFDEANHFAINGYSVYGVLADWDKDTTQSKDGPWHDLLVTSPLVKLTTDGLPRE